MGARNELFELIKLPFTVATQSVRNSQSAKPLSVIIPYRAFAHIVAAPGRVDSISTLYNQTVDQWLHGQLNAVTAHSQPWVYQKCPESNRMILTVVKPDAKPSIATRLVLSQDNPANLITAYPIVSKNNWRKSGVSLQGRPLLFQVGHDLETLPDGLLKSLSLSESDLGSQPQPSPAEPLTPLFLSKNQSQSEDRVALDDDSAVIHPIEVKIPKLESAALRGVKEELAYLEADITTYSDLLDQMKSNLYLVECNVQERLSVGKEHVNYEAIRAYTYIVTTNSVELNADFAQVTAQPLIISEQLEKVRSVMSARNIDFSNTEFDFFDQQRLKLEDIADQLQCDHIEFTTRWLESQVAFLETAADILRHLKPLAQYGVEVLANQQSSRNPRPDTRRATVHLYALAKVIVAKFDPRFIKPDFKYDQLVEFSNRNKDLASESKTEAKMKTHALMKEISDFTSVLFDKVLFDDRFQVSRVIGFTNKLISSLEGAEGNQQRKVRLAKIAGSVGQLERAKKEFQPVLDFYENPKNRVVGIKSITNF